MKRWLVLLCASVALTACASADSVKQAQGQGVTRTFRQQYDAVYQATLNSAARRKLEVIEQDRAAGRLVLANKGGWTSIGEYIAIFVSRGGDRSTVVEIVSKPVGGPVTFPPDWPALIFGDIEQELTPRRPK
jgi:hypothetical protein